MVIAPLLVARAYTAGLTTCVRYSTGSVEPRDDRLRRARRLVKKVGQILTKLAFAERRRHDEVGFAPLAIRAEQERGPVAGGALDHDETAENVESVLRHCQRGLREPPVPCRIRYASHGFGY